MQKLPALMIALQGDADNHGNTYARALPDEFNRLGIRMLYRSTMRDDLADAAVVPLPLLVA